jgi:hypothetical protein
MELRPVQQSITNSSLRVRGKAPEKFVGGPELRWGLQLYYDAFFDLDTERSHGFGYTRIPWHCIVAYAMYYNLDDEQTEELVTHIQAMDSAYIKKLKDDADAKRTK